MNCTNRILMKKIILLPLLFLVVACGTTPSAEVAQAQEPVVTEVDVFPDASSGATNVESQLSLNGTITLPPQSNVTISLPISGIVSSFSLLAGSYVQKGQTIAVLENTEFIDLQQGYLEAAAEVEFLETEHNRQKNLSQHDVTSAKRLQQSKSEYLSAKSRKEAFGAKLSILGVSPKSLISNGIAEKLTVAAPQSGYVSNVMVNQGKFVAVGEPICQIINKSQMLLHLIAYEKDLVQLKIGQTITFKANGLGDEVFGAIITEIDQQVDPVSRSIKVYARPSNLHIAFRPGMYVVAMI